ncbi:MAG: hypothetical protein ABFD92_16895 [Planctomycetaceae bacterium]|nr:hypothetical protein [Planctomycetaceae bacterium]
MTAVQLYKPASRGCMLRPPLMRVYHTPVVAGPSPRWRTERLRPYWTPIHLQWQADGAPAGLEVSVVLGAGSSKSRQHSEDEHCHAGDRIRLVQVHSGSGGGGP